MSSLRGRLSCPGGCGPSLAWEEGCSLQVGQKGPPRESLSVGVLRMGSLSLGIPKVLFQEATGLPWFFHEDVSLLIQGTFSVQPAKKTPHL